MSDAPGTGPIEGVVFEPLTIVADARGAVLHMLKESSPLFTRFGEIYFSETQPGVVKAWKLHRRMLQRIAVPVGRIKLVLYDDRAESPTRGRSMAREIGRPDAYSLVVIPPGVWYGWQAIASGPSLLANCADRPHDPAESVQAETIPSVGESSRSWWTVS